MPTTNFVAESWSYIGISIVIVAFRVISRWRNLGFRGLAPDDFLMVVAMLLYTAETATAYYVGAYWKGFANNSMTPEQRASLDPHSVEYYLRIKGSQTQVFGWFVYTSVLWVLKLCWLFLYSRLGEGVHNMRLKVQVGFVVIILTYVALALSYIFACWPMSKNWQINPDPGNFCQPAISKLKVYMVITMNLSTDFYIMSIPLPMIWATRMTIKKKLGLALMFCGGLLTTMCGLLRCVLILTAGPAGAQQAGEWSCRESFLAVFVSNVPVVFPQLRRIYLEATGQMTTASTESKLKSSSFKLGNLTSSSRRNRKFKHPLSIPDDTIMNQTQFERYGSDEMIVISEEQTIPGQSKIHSNSSDPEHGVKGNDIRITTQWMVQSKEEEQGNIKNFQKDRHQQMFSQTSSRP